jgi:hypothetical protein
VRGESSVVWPDGRPRRLEAEEWLSIAVLALVRFVLGRTIRVPLSRIWASVASSRLAGRAGRFGGGPSGRVKDSRAKVVGVKSESWGMRTGREIMSLGVVGRRRVRPPRYDAGDTMAGLRGFGGGTIACLWGLGGDISTEIWGSGGGGGE